ncbi:putative defense protein Hdd11-like [Cimex lectularius]|uniref:Reelin domain-containing protein n=1 Tax=Cimex lectularius TaxID=79782 RepID=A0A8I6RQF8_CIMLE|nr:putative defense protein Hdd11-like [Cimex lectularius]
MKSFYLIFTIAFILFGFASSYKSGAPKETCEDMTPQHKVPPQKSRSPYVIRLSRTKIHAGESVDVTITGKTTETFKGFLLQARLGSTPVGKFSTKGSSNLVKLTDCGSGSQNAATHASPDDKKEVVLRWTAPPNLKETVVFYATVAKNGGEFWVSQKSRNLVVV